MIRLFRIFLPPRSAIYRITSCNTPQTYLLSTHIPRDLVFHINKSKEIIKMNCLVVILVNLLIIVCPSTASWLCESIPRGLIGSQLARKWRQRCSSYPNYTAKYSTEDKPSPVTSLGVKPMFREDDAAVISVAHGVGPR
jgi:hypothetical protein